MFQSYHLTGQQLRPAWSISHHWGHAGQVEAPESFSASLRRLFTVAGTSATAQGFSFQLLTVNVLSVLSASLVFS